MHPGSVLPFPFFPSSTFLFIFYLMHFDCYIPLKLPSWFDFYITRPRCVTDTERGGNKSFLLPVRTPDPHQTIGVTKTKWVRVCSSHKDDGSWIIDSFASLIEWMKNFTSCRRPRAWQWRKAAGEFVPDSPSTRKGGNTSLSPRGNSPSETHKTSSLQI